MDEQFDALSDAILKTTNAIFGSSSTTVSNYLPTNITAKSIMEVIAELQNKLKTEHTMQEDVRIKIKNEILEKIRMLSDLIDEVITFKETHFGKGYCPTFILAKERIQQIEKLYFLNGNITKGDMLFMNTVWVLCNEECKIIKELAKKRSQ